VLSLIRAESGSISPRETVSFNVRTSFDCGSVNFPVTTLRCPCSIAASNVSGSRRNTTVPCSKIMHNGLTFPVWGSNAALLFISITPSVIAFLSVRKRPVCGSLTTADSGSISSYLIASSNVHSLIVRGSLNVPRWKSIEPRRTACWKVIGRSTVTSRPLSKAESMVYARLVLGSTIRPRGTSIDPSSIPELRLFSCPVAGSLSAVVFASIKPWTKAWAMSNWSPTSGSVNLPVSGRYSPHLTASSTDSGFFDVTMSPFSLASFRVSILLLSGTLYTPRSSSMRPASTASGNLKYLPDLECLTIDFKGFISSSLQASDNINFLPVDGCIKQPESASYSPMTIASKSPKPALSISTISPSSMASDRETVQLAPGSLNVPALLSMIPARHVSTKDRRRSDFFSQ